MAIKDLFTSMLGSVAKEIKSRLVSIDLVQPEPESGENENFGNVGPDRRSIQTSSGKLYPPNLARTQPGEYGLRARGGLKFQEALGRLINDNQPVWSGQVDVSIVGKPEAPSLEIKRGSDVLGIVSAATLLEHPLVLKAAREGKAFRGATDDFSQGGLYLRIFFTL